MKKTTTILFLGLTLVSFNALAQEQSMFNDFAVEAVMEEVMAKEQEHPLKQEDNRFLLDIENMQKNITLMQLELKEKELELRVREQMKKIDELDNPVEELEPLPCVETETSILDSFIPMPEVSSEEEFDVSAPLIVRSIKGIEGDLRARVASNDIGVVVVKEGDIINNGSKILNISKKSVTIEDANGNIETIGMSFRN